MGIKKVPCPRCRQRRQPAAECYLCHGTNAALAEEATEWRRDWARSDGTLQDSFVPCPVCRGVPEGCSFCGDYVGVPRYRAEAWAEVQEEALGFELGRRLAQVRDPADVIPGLLVMWAMGRPVTLPVLKSLGSKDARTERALEVLHGAWLDVQRLKRDKSPEEPE